MFSSHFPLRTKKLCPFRWSVEHLRPEWRRAGIHRVGTLPSYKRVLIPCVYIYIYNFIYSLSAVALFAPQSSLSVKTGVACPSCSGKRFFSQASPLSLSHSPLQRLRPSSCCEATPPTATIGYEPQGRGTRGKGGERCDDAHTERKREKSREDEAGESESGQRGQKI